MVSRPGQCKNVRESRDSFWCSPRYTVLETALVVSVQTFRELLTHQPFKSFHMVMSSGESHEVGHPEMAMLTRTSILVGTDIADDGVPAEFKTCSLLHATAIEPLTSCAGGTGQHAS